MQSSLAQATKASRIDAILAAQKINGFELPGGTDKQTLHSYGPVYEELFAPFIDQANCNILEIGVQYGGSILLWDQLCPNASIVGMDIRDAVHPSIRERVDSNRVSFLFTDAYTTDALSMANEDGAARFSVIIDDGPHTLDSQVAFLGLYPPLLTEDGVAVIEDVQSIKWFTVLQECLPTGFSGEVVDRRHVKNRYDDLMFVIRREKL